MKRIGIDEAPPKPKGTCKARSGTSWNGGQPERAERVYGGAEDKTHRTTAVGCYIGKERVWIWGGGV